jgi:predicted metal-binding membrane protein
MVSRAAPERLSMHDSRLTAVLRQDRYVVLLGLAGITAAAWGYMVYLAQAMSSMDMVPHQAMAEMQGWGATDLLLLFVMWAVMMVAMMIPSAAPMILLFATINRKRRQLERPFVPTSVFVLGYLAIWTAFSIAATLVQWALHAAALLSPMMVSSSPVLGGVLLIGAGIFQWTPLKRTCLEHCRSPLDFLMADWREGSRGAFVMGAHHGLYCLGCCWFLMALLFVAGVVNLFWVAAIAFFVLVEKLAPAGGILGRIPGTVLSAAGIGLLIQVI